MVIGANPTDGHPVFASRMKQRACAQGAKLIVVDPRRIDIVDRAAREGRRIICNCKPRHQRRGGQRARARDRHRRAAATSSSSPSAANGARSSKWRDFVALPENAPEATEAVTGVPANEVREAARSTRRAATRRSTTAWASPSTAQGSTMVMGIANLAMATGNVGREGVGVNPLRGQNNVQGSLRHGLVPARAAGLPPHQRHDRARAVRGRVERRRCKPSRVCAFRTCSTPRIDGSFKGLYCQGEDIVQSDPNTQHVAAALSAMECIVVQDIFLNETAKYAHVLLPGSTLPREGRHLHQRGAPHLARAQGHAAGGRLRRLGSHADARRARSATKWTTSIRPKSWTRSRASRRPSTA